jgi:hypothetical protein
MVHTSILTMLILLQGHLLMYVSFSLWWSKGSFCSNFFALIFAWHLNKILVLQRFNHSGGCSCSGSLAKRNKNIVKCYRIWTQNYFSVLTYWCNYPSNSFKIELESKWNCWARFFAHRNNIFSFGHNLTHIHYIFQAIFVRSLEVYFLLCFGQKLL